MTKVILRLPEVKARTGLSRSSIYLHMSQGQFPLQVKLSARCVGWFEHEIEAYLAEKASERIAINASH